MNYIKLKIFVGILLIHLIDQICCETNTLEDKYETVKETLLSVTIHRNITSFSARIDKEYNHLLNIFNGQIDKNIENFIKQSKKQIFQELNNSAQIVNKFILDEQSDHEDFVRRNINIFKKKTILVDHCLKNNNLMKNALRCIDQHQNTNNETDIEFYENFNNLFDTYNILLSLLIDDIENKFITATDEILSIAKNINNELIEKKPSINIPSTAPTKKNNLNVKHSVSETHVNNTLKNLYINQKNMLNTANLMNWIVIQSMSLNTSLNHISKMMNIVDHDRKKVRCCFNNLKVELNKAKNIAVNDSNQCVEGEKLNLEILVSSESKEAKKHFPTCFYNDSRLEDIFECIGGFQSSNYAPNISKVIYNEAVDKFNKNQQLLSGKIFNCSYKTRDYFGERLINLNNQFDNCVQPEKALNQFIFNSVNP